MRQHILETLEHSLAYLQRFLASDDNLQSIDNAVSVLVKTLESGGAIYTCGNGGSMSDAMHFAEELTGRYRKNRAPLAATAISDPGHISCVANDYGYDYVFSRYLEARAKPGDCLLAISTSGRSNNVIKAAAYARANGVAVISLTGASGTELGMMASVDISTGASAYADRIQEVHIKVIHILIESIERHFFPENYES
jgi:D-sedoheptulose 7-phosphate isomerase